MMTQSSVTGSRFGDDPVMTRPLRLLLVEDSEDDALLLLNVIRKAGYLLVSEQVETLEDLHYALERQVWDVIIADYVLPNFTAEDALAMVQSRNLDLPFIVVSGIMGEETAVSIMRSGAHDYLLKDRLSRLVPAIERELREAEIRRQKQQAETALREELETLVQQRTTELQNANQALRQFEAIVESSEDAIISTTLQGRVISWNRAAEKIYGYTRQEAIGQWIESLILPNTTLFPSIANSSDYQRVIHRRKDGRLIDVFLTTSSIQSSSGYITGTSWIARDITELRAVERMKDEFVSVVSHELRTPLTSVRASLGLLLMGKLGTLPDASFPFIEVAVRNTDRLIRLINDILDLERLDSGEIAIDPQLCNVADLMTQAVATMQGIAGAQHIQVTPLSVKVSVDPDRIVQTMTNLLSNAIKFSPTGSIVTFTAQQRDQAIVIAVSDRGRGIPPESLETIFGRFQQVDASDARQYGGTGLGLAISQSIIRQHGGQIWVESTPGVGSTFFFSIPVN